MFGHRRRCAFCSQALSANIIARYGPYFLPFPVASMLLWPALPGTQPDLVAWTPLVIALTSLLIWNGPTMAAIFQPSEASSRNTQSRGTCTDPEPLPGPGSFSRSSLDSYQGVVAYQRTLSWANDPGRPWSRFVVCRTRSAVDSVNSSGRDFESERSISLSEGSLGRQPFDPTLVETWPTPLPGYEEGLQDRVNGFHASRHGSFRTMSPVCMDG